MFTDWKLTDEEKAKCEQWGCSMAKAQADKKRAYVANGGVILIPDAFEDMYEALKALLENSELDPDNPNRAWQRACPSNDAVVMGFKALSKAEDK